MRTFGRLIIPSALAISVAACGKSEAPPAPGSVDTSAPAAPVPDEPGAAPVGETDNNTPAAPAAEAAPPHWLAWRQDGDGELFTALIVEKASGPETIATVQGKLYLTEGGRVLKLANSESTIPVRPCDEDAKANFIDLGVTGLVPRASVKLVTLADATQRPKLNENAIHSELLVFQGHAGPFVWLHHEMNSDICPIPGTGAVYDARKLVDLRDLSVVDTADVFETAEKDKVLASAFDLAVASIAKDFPEAKPEGVKAAMKVSSLDCGWGAADGTFACTLTVWSENPEQPSDSDDPNPFVETVPVPVPEKLAPHVADKPPAAVTAFWALGSDKGRGFSPISAEQAEEIRLGMLASPPPATR